MNKMITIRRLDHTGHSTLQLDSKVAQTEKETLVPQGYVVAYNGKVYTDPDDLLTDILKNPETNPEVVQMPAMRGG